MMRSLRSPWLMLLLVPALVLAGCGDDDGADTPTGADGDGETTNGNGDGGDTPNGSSGDGLSAGAAFFQELSASMNQAAALLFTGGGQIEGEQGRVVVTGSDLTFEEYSPDGEVVIDGQLAINLLVQPIAVTGQLTLSGAESGTADVNVTIDLATTPLTYGGTISLDGVEYDVAAIAAEGQAGEDD